MRDVMIMIEDILYLVILIGGGILAIIVRSFIWDLIHDREWSFKDNKFWIVAFIIAFITAIIVFILRMW